MAKRIKLKLGDLIEIPTTNGFAYAQLSHQTQFGDLLRMLPGTFDSRPADLSNLVLKRDKLQFVTPMSTWVNEGIFRVVGNFPVPEFASSLPSFKLENLGTWSIRKGEVDQRVPQLTEEQKDFPCLMIIGHDYVVELAEKQLANRDLPEWAKQ